MAIYLRTMDNLDLAGDLALDFANSASAPIDDGGATERLHGYPDLVTFARRTELIGPDRAAELTAEAERRPADASSVFERGRVLRDTIESIFKSIAAKGSPGEEDIAVLNSFLEEGMPFRRLEPAGRCCGWTWSVGAEPLAQMLWPIANHAAELMVTGDLDRIKECGNEECGWIFLDSSRNRSRRWCDMTYCGNRAKARRHYARRRSEPPAA